MWLNLAKFKKRAFWLAQRTLTPNPLFNPFGDFDLLFGAAKLNLKIVDMPIHYRNRSYGDIKIHRWRHGLLLLRMSWKAFVKLKLS